PRDDGPGDRTRLPGLGLRLVGVRSLGPVALVGLDRARGRAHRARALHRTAHPAGPRRSGPYRHTGTARPPPGPTMGRADPAAAGHVADDPARIPRQVLVRVSRPAELLLAWFEFAPAVDALAQASAPGRLSFRPRLAVLRGSGRQSAHLPPGSYTNRSRVVLLSIRIAIQVAAGISGRAGREGRVEPSHPSAAPQARGLPAAARGRVPARRHVPGPSQRRHPLHAPAPAAPLPLAGWADA